MTTGHPVDALIVALPESAGSALYGMLDVLASTGTLWRELSGAPPGHQQIRPRIVSVSRDPFVCGNAIPVTPEFSVDDDPAGELIIIPELWLAPDDDMAGRYPALLDWLCRRHQAGCAIYTACSGAVLLAATGLLDGREATSHWGYQDLFRKSFPRVTFRAESSLVFADRSGRIVTAGGTTSWHDLALHIISRHCSPGEALRVAKVYLLKSHPEGQLPYTNLVRRQPHADSAVRAAETWLGQHFADAHALAGAVEASTIPERSLKRRFKSATGATLIDYVQNLRIEAAKTCLETSDEPFEDICVQVGYENAAFFRRLFKRATGLTPADYRRMFRAIGAPGATNARGERTG